MNALVKYERIYDNNISNAIVYVAVAHCKSQHLFAYRKSIEIILKAIFFAIITLNQLKLLL